MKYLKILAVSLLAFTQSAWAEEESWYTYWAIGISRNSYSDKGLNTLMTPASSYEDRTQIGADAWGFYFPMESNTALGFVVGESIDIWTLTSPTPNFPNLSYQVAQYLYSVSAMHFLGKEIGDGFFVRGDVGLAKTIEVATVGNSSGSFGTKDTGFGGLLGIGYGLAISEETRILFSLNVASKKIKNQTYSYAAFEIGGLW